MAIQVIATESLLRDERDRESLATDSGSLGSSSGFPCPAQCCMIPGGATPPSGAGRKPGALAVGWPLLHTRLQHARPLGHALDHEVDPSDLAPVGGFYLDLPVARLIVRLEPVAAKALLAPADDIDGDAVLQLPAAYPPASSTSASSPGRKSGRARRCGRTRRSDRPAGPRSTGRRAARAATTPARGSGGSPPRSAPPRDRRP